MNVTIEVAVSVLKCHRWDIFFILNVLDCSSWSSWVMEECQKKQEKTGRNEWQIRRQVLTTGSINTTSVGKIKRREAMIGTPRAGWFLMGNPIIMDDEPWVGYDWFKNQLNPKQKIMDVQKCHHLDFLSVAQNVPVLQKHSKWACVKLSNNYKIDPQEKSERSLSTRLYKVFHNSRADFFEQIRSWLCQSSGLKTRFLAISRFWNLYDFAATCGM